MGARGAAPKPNSRRAAKDLDRRNGVVQVKGEVQQPHAFREWHRVARSWYDSLPKSAQAQYYEPSDWQLAKVAAEMLSDWFNTPLERRSTAFPKQFLDIQKALSTTHLYRLSSHIEVSRDIGLPVDTEQKPDNVTSWRERLA